MKQQHDRVVFRPKLIKELNTCERKRAMSTLMFIEQKRNLDSEEIKLKGRSYTNGSTQRSYMNKEETSSPTATQEGILITCAIDAKETGKWQQCIYVTHSRKHQHHLNLEKTG